MNDKEKNGHHWTAQRLEVDDDIPSTAESSPRPLAPRKNSGGMAMALNGLGDDMVERKELPGEKRIRMLKQLVMFFAASWGYSPAGMALTWPNNLASDIRTDNRTFFDTELSLTNTQMDMVASMMFIGSVPGFLAAGWLCKTIGRKRSMMISSLPGMVGSLLIALSVNREMIYAGRFLEGTSYGLMGVAIRPYIVEIADTEIRGAAVVFAHILQQIGGISAVSLGIPFMWYQVSFFSCAFYAAYTFLVVPMLPESPTFLAVTGKVDKAAVVLRRLRGPAADVEHILWDLKKQNENVESGWSILIKPSVLKQELVLFGIFFIANFSGVEVIKANTARILQSSGLALSDQVSAIMVICVLFCGNLAMMLVVDRLGRKRCLIVSLSMVSIAYSVLGAFVFLTSSPKPEPQLASELETLIEANTELPLEVEEAASTLSSYSWIPLVCLMTAAFGQALGLGPLPWVLASEYFPTAIRSQTMMVCTLSGSLMTFAAMQLFSPIQTLLTQPGLYWSYCVTAAIGVPFTFFLIRETKGRSVG